MAVPEAADKSSKLDETPQLDLPVWEGRGWEGVSDLHWGLNAGPLSDLHWGLNARPLRFDPPYQNFIALVSRAFLSQPVTPTLTTQRVA